MTIDSLARRIAPADSRPSPKAQPHASRTARGYRPDLDGLRAVAVTAVVLYHAGLGAFSGGFVGVDIFFVISGFLIGGIVADEVAREQFRFVNFYLRRARRILPALIVVTLVTCAAGYILLSAKEYAHLATSGVSALLGVSNFRFWMLNGYFAPDVHLDPFLMTWSLGVEEQFYLMLPPILLLLRRFRFRVRIGVIMAGTIASLILCVAITKVSPQSAFYLIPMRAWELGLGVLVALAGLGGGGRLSPISSNVLAILSLLAIAAAVALYSPRTEFPGYAAIVPVLATAVLLVTRRSWINQALLSSGPAVQIGLISYSWYLWHWPIFAFLRICCLRDPTTTAFLIGAVVSLAAGFLSWRFVETPFRRPSPTPKPQLLARYGAALACAAAAVAVVKVGEGLPGRLPSLSRQFEHDVEASANPCVVGYGVEEPNLSARCVPPSDRPKIVLIGDSHADALAPGLSAWANRAGFRLEQLTKSSCPPVIGLTLETPGYPLHAAQCARYNQTVARMIESDPAIRLVVMTAVWTPIGDTDRSPRNYASVAPDGSIHEEHRDALATAVSRTVRDYRGAGKKVVVLDDVPTFRFDPARALFAQFLPARMWALQVFEPAAALRTGVAGPDYLNPGLNSRLVRQGAAEGGASAYESLRDILCSPAGCRFYAANGAPLFRDSHHLSVFGSQYVVDRMRWTSLPASPARR